MAEEHDNHSYEWGLPCDHVLYDLKATSHKPYIQNQKNELTQSRLRIFFILSGEPKLCTFSFLILSFRATLLITWMVWSTPEIRRHATTVPSRLHCNKVCSSHSYSLNQIWTGDTGIYVNEVSLHSSADVPAWGSNSSLYVFQARASHLCHLTWTSTIRARDTHPGTPVLSPTATGELRTCNIYIYLWKGQRNAETQYKRGAQNW